MCAAVRADFISIHALREEGDRRWGCWATSTKRFLSTPSARRATGGQFLFHAGNRDFYPRPPRGGRQFAVFTPAADSSISIHALREEGDFPCTTSAT